MLHGSKTAWRLAMLWALLLVPALAPAQPDDFAPAVAALNADGFDAKARAAERLAAVEHPRTVHVLAAMLEGDLYRRRSDERIVIVTGESEQGRLLEDAVTGDALAPAGRRDVRRIGVNNSLRRTLRGLIARIRLGADERGVRLAAVNEMFRAMDAESAALLRAALEDETDGAVRRAMQQALALRDLGSDDVPTRLAAIDTLSGSVASEVRGRLAALRDNDALDAETRARARQALVRIEQKLERYRLIETVFFGLSLGSVLVLAAIGLAITFGVMGVINMAHGELIMLGAYTTYVVQQLMPGHIGASVLVAVPAAFLVAALAGIAIERGVIRHLYGRPLETLLATFGISLVLQQTVRSIFSPLNRSVATPEWMSGSLEITAGLSITYNRLYIIVFSLLVFAALVVVLQRTRLGLEVRAVSQNRAMARAMGVRSDWVDAMTFGLGAGIAGVAGVALSQLTNVGPNLGQAYIVDSFMVVVFGGVGNVWGTLVGGLSLGVANKFLEPYAGAVMAKVAVLVFIILFIQKRPRGLFPQRGRAAEA